MNRKPGGQARVELSDEDLYQAYVANGRQASPLAGLLECTPSQARRRVASMLQRMEQHPVTTPRDPELLNRVAEILERSNVDPNAISRIRGLKFKSYGIGIKNAKGEIETQGLYSTAFSADPIINASDNPCITQAPPITVLYQDAPHVMRGIRSVVVVSDAQIGFLNGPQGMESIHDDLAVDVTTQIVAAEQPSELVFIGDWLDLTQFSRWPQQPEFSGCAQASIDAGGRILAEMISAAGPRCTQRIVVSGNHDIRLERYALANAQAFLGLRRAGRPEEWPCMSMPYLLHFDSLGVTYKGHFPGSPHWITDALACVHEPPKRLELQASIIHGHDHKLTQETYAQHGRFQRMNYFKFSIGCICKVGSRSDPKSLMLTQTPSDRARTDWAQGVCLVEIIDDKSQRFQVTQTHINDGRAIHRGQVFEARQLAEAA